MKIQTKLGVVVAGIAAVILSTAAVQAVPITGDIGFLGFSGTSQSGGITTFAPDNPWVDVGGTGSYALTGGALVTFNSISFTGTGTGAALTSEVDPLWIFKVGGLTYSFNLTSLIDADVTANSVSLSGIGTAYITGDTATTATWSLEGAGANEKFDIDFSATSAGPGGTGGSGGSTVPDGGSTVMMLGLALGAGALFTRKLHLA
jgi:hypothetical protein